MNDPMDPHASAPGWMRHRPRLLIALAVVCLGLAVPTFNYASHYRTTMNSADSQERNAIQLALTPTAYNLEQSRFMVRDAQNIREIAKESRTTAIALAAVEVVCLAALVALWRRGRR